MRTVAVRWLVIVCLLFFAQVAYCANGVYFGFTMNNDVDIDIKNPILINADSAMEHGVLKSMSVDEVISDSPADKAGLHTGDQIIEFAGVVVKGTLLSKILEAKAPIGVGQTLELKILRDGKPMTIQMIGAPAPSEDTMPNAQVQVK